MSVTVELRPPKSQHSTTKLQADLNHEILSEGDLYVSLDECYVYSRPGKDSGLPLESGDIIYTLQPNEIVICANDIRSKHYLHCSLPVTGWVFMPAHIANLRNVPTEPNVMGSNGVRKNSAPINGKSQPIFGKSLPIYSEDNPAIAAKSMEVYRKSTLAFEEEKMNASPKGDLNTFFDAADSNEMPSTATLIMGNKGVSTESMADFHSETRKHGQWQAVSQHFQKKLAEKEKRRDYKHQRFVPLESEPRIRRKTKSKFHQFLEKNKFISQIIFYFRRHPFLPGLIIILIQAFIEGIIFSDVVTDFFVAMQLWKFGNIYLFMLCSMFILAPYFIAWCALSQYSVRYLEKHKNSFKWTFLVAMFDIAPIGTAFLILGDIYHCIEYAFVRPIFYLFSGGKQIRNISFEELGYYKLRRVSEIFAESLPQTALQGFMFAVQVRGAHDFGVGYFSLGTSLLSSMFILSLWVLILHFEAKKNGLTLVEYLPIVYRGSFTFVPFLPAIERGTENGIAVNWVGFKMSLEAVGNITRSVTSATCQLQTVKISLYTISEMHRHSCRYFGKMLNGVEIILTRLEEDVRHLFNQYDVDDSFNFDFHQFSRVFMAMKRNAEEPTFKDEILDLFISLADHAQSPKVWLLDLMVKVNTSVSYSPLLDFDHPLTYAFHTNNINLLSLLIGSGYHHFNSDNFDEFTLCVKKAVITNKIQMAMVLCENLGVPVVIRIKSGHDLKYSERDTINPYLTVSLCGMERRTTTQYDTTNPTFDDDLLFIIPNDIMPMLRDGSHIDTMITSLETTRAAAGQSGVNWTGMTLRHDSLTGGTVHSHLSNIFTPSSRQSTQTSRADFIRLAQTLRTMHSMDVGIALKQTTTAQPITNDRLIVKPNGLTLAQIGSQETLTEENQKIPHLSDENKSNDTTQDRTEAKSDNNDDNDGDNEQNSGDDNSSDSQSNNETKKVTFEVTTPPASKHRRIASNANLEMPALFRTMFADQRNGAGGGGATIGHSRTMTMPQIEIEKSRKLRIKLRMFDFENSTKDDTHIGTSYVSIDLSKSLLNFNDKLWQKELRHYIRHSSDRITNVSTENVGLIRFRVYLNVYHFNEMYGNDTIDMDSNLFNSGDTDDVPSSPQTVPKSPSAQSHLALRGAKYDPMSAISEGNSSQMGGVSQSLGGTTTTTMGGSSRSYRSAADELEQNLEQTLAQSINFGSNPSM